MTKSSSKSKSAAKPATNKKLVAKAKKPVAKKAGLKAKFRCEAYKFGGALCDPDAIDCLAKVESGVENTQIHYIKVANPFVHTNWGVVDPNGRDFKVEQLGQIDKFTGKLFYEWKQVRLNTFNFYLDFLKTGNKGLISQINRLENL